MVEVKFYQLKKMSGDQQFRLEENLMEVKDDAERRVRSERVQKEKDSVMLDI